ncbi:hypothetical protein MNBD_UNCLBAC01-1530 [hydrothermal vent metagenome]|uniref:Uncharacterized protein n=1 Tax=hydrothermal vent metagenome TaxID=652676 RepID=A0A3B1D7W5_9ZZZZ
MSNSIRTPESRDWNNFWSLEETKKFTQVSWSKKRIIRTLSPYINKGKSALDAGCGSGFFSKFFCDQDMQTVSLDYSKQALEIAKAMTEGRTKAIKKDLLFLDVASEIEERFDVIFSDGLLEHFSAEDQNKIVGNFFSLLKDDGVVVTFVPNRWSPWQLIRPFFMPGIEETPFVLKDLINVHERNGLTVIQQGGLNTFPFAFSPDKFFGRTFGMLLFTVSKK